MTDEPRWLDDRERTAWLGLAGLVIRLPAAMETANRQATGLGLYEYVTMAMLSEQPGRALRMSELAAMSSSSLSRLSHVVSRLEARGWLQRSPHPDDGRATTVQLTEAGWQTVVEAAPGHLEMARRLVIDALTPEQVDQLGAITGVVLDRLDRELGPAPRPPARGSRPD